MEKTYSILKVKQESLVEIYLNAPNWKYTMNVTKYRFIKSKKEREPVHFIAKCEHRQVPRIRYSNQKVFATHLQNKWKGLNKIQISIYLFTLRQIFFLQITHDKYYTSLLPHIYTSWKTKTFRTLNNKQLTSLETHTCWQRQWSNYSFHF